MRDDRHARLTEWFFWGMAGTVMVSIFSGFLFLTGCSPFQVKPGCENSWANDSKVDLAMNVGAIGLSEYLLQHPEHRPEAKKAIKAALLVLKQDVITLDVLVTALQKGISSRDVRARLGYVSILGTGRQEGVALNLCEKEYLVGYFQRLLMMVE